MHDWLLSRTLHSLSPRERDPPSPTITIIAVIVARTAPLSSTQYVTNDCASASFGTTDAPDAFWFFAACSVTFARPTHATQICGSLRSTCVSLDVRPVMLGDKTRL